MQCTVYVGELKLINKYTCILKQHQITHAEIKFYKYFHPKGVCQEYEEKQHLWSTMVQAV